MGPGDQHQHRARMRGGLHAVEAELGIGGRLQRGDQERHVRGQAARHHRVDGDVLHRRLGPARRHHRDHLASPVDPSRRSSPARAPGSAARTGRPSVHRRVWKASRTSSSSAKVSCPRRRLRRRRGAAPRRSSAPVSARITWGSASSARWWMTLERLAADRVLDDRQREIGHAEAPRLVPRQADGRPRCRWSRWGCPASPARPSRGYTTTCTTLSRRWR